MRLPDGMTYHPREKDLIAKNGRAIIEIATNRFPGNEKYNINDRTFNFAIAPYLRGDWADLDRLFRLKSRRTVKAGTEIVKLPVIYSGAEHRATPKKPNITVVPNLQVAELRGAPRPFSVLGCTMGHWHLTNSGDPRIQEIYEFQSYGLLAMDREQGEVEVWVARDGDKVPVPSGCHMTLYNLGDEDQPLITLDFADPDRNRSDKKQIETFGPILLAHYDDLEVVFTLSHLYINNSSHRAGVRLPFFPEELQDRQVKIARVGRYDLGEFLYEELTENPEVVARFAKLAMQIKRASPEAFLCPYPRKGGSYLYFSRPLTDAVHPGTDVSRYFFPNEEEAKPRFADAVGIVGRAARVAHLKERLGEPKLHRRKAVIVVEGAGSWVTDAYRPVFKELNSQGKRISVFYADDTRWKEAPEWTNNLEEYETYLDKSDPDDFAMYCNLPPDMVFVVTPDFTHSLLARWWLSKRAPLVFVEKPFDSQLKNVEALFNALGRNPVTTVLGLDHYQFRALKIRESLPQITDHLGGALAEVNFYMTETQLLELQRIRTLQYGLTLDMLPHLLALLTFFGDVGSVDEIQVLDAGRYGPEFKAKGKDKEWKEIEADVSGHFLNETYSKVRFTFEDYSGNGYRVPCTAVVGKGFKTATKFLEITGRNGNAIRVEFSGEPDPDPTPGYPWRSIILLLGKDAADVPGTLKVDDPHKRGRQLRIRPGQQPVEKSKGRYYQSLVDDLVNGTSTTLGSTLLPGESWEIVRALDQVWWAIQAFREERGWSEQVLQQTDPLDFA